MAVIHLLWHDEPVVVPCRPHNAATALNVLRAQRAALDDAFLSP
jgi:hypothetical protein